MVLFPPLLDGAHGLEVHQPRPRAIRLDLRRGLLLLHHHPVDLEVGGGARGTASAGVDRRQLGPTDAGWGSTDVGWGSTDVRWGLVGLFQTEWSLVKKENENQVCPRGTSCASVVVGVLIEHRLAPP